VLHVINHLNEAVAVVVADPFSLGVVNTVTCI
jgi:hypothetical protein